MGEKQTKCPKCGAGVSCIKGGEPREVFFSCKSKTTDENFTESHKCAHRQTKKAEARISALERRLYLVREAWKQAEPDPNFDSLMDDAINGHAATAKGQA